MPRRPRYHVYVIELSKDVLDEPRFRRSNPDYIEAKPCVYVGMMRLDPGLRFDDAVQKNSRLASTCARPVLASDRPDSVLPPYGDDSACTSLACGYTLGRAATAHHPYTPCRNHASSPALRRRYTQSRPACGLRATK